MAKASFRRGALGSPWSTEVMGPEALDANSPAAQPSEEGPRIGAGVLGRDVEMEVSRMGRRSRGRGRRDRYDDE